MKEPDKWCIKVTPENREAIEKWRTASAISECKGYCVNKNSFNPSIGYWYPDKPNEYTEISFEEFKVYTSKPLKQAVHCTTQEEWDFVCDKINYIFYHKFNIGYHDTIDIMNLKESFKSYYKDYQILSFQEWCDLNGYKMKKETMFEPGKWYSFYWTWYNSGLVIIKVLSENDNSVKVSYYYRRGSFYDNSECDYAFKLSEIKDIKELSIEEIQQYLPDNHPDKIKSNQEFKVGDWVIVVSEYSGCNGKLGKLYKAIENSDNGYFRYENHSTIDTKLVKIRFATSEEINNHLISIGQIPTEKYPFKKLEEDDLTWEIKTEGIRWTEPVPVTKDNWKHEMLLSVDDEEFPMVNIIKTNTVKQLLNND